MAVTSREIMEELRISPLIHFGLYMSQSAFPADQKQVTAYRYDFIEREAANQNARPFTGRGSASSDYQLGGFVRLEVAWIVL